MIISRYFVWFVIYSCMGWIFETIYCTTKEHSWQNRGFLYGPICPIYGCGALAISALVEFFPACQDLTWWQLFLIGYAGSVVLEYGTSWALEKLFHAKWWDYSDMPLNINGRICVPASCLFGLGAILIVRGIYPWMNQMTSHFTPIWIEAFSLGFMAVVAGDSALTVSALTHFDRELQAMENSLNQHMEAFVSSLEDKRLELGDRVEQTKAGIGELMDKKVLDTQHLIMEESKRFADERIDIMTQRMGHLHTSALSRVKSFTANAPVSAPEIHMPKLQIRLEKNKALSLVKDKYLKRKQDN